jgi:hypothetical protein
MICEALIQDEKWRNERRKCAAMYLSVVGVRRVQQWDFFLLHAEEE